MWLAKLAKDTISIGPAALAILCPCGRKFSWMSNFSTVNNGKNQNSGGGYPRFMSSSCSASPKTFKENEARRGAESSKQRDARDSNTSSSCFCGLALCRRPTLTATAENFPLTGIPMYGTDPAFKTSESSLSLLKRYRRKSLQLPLPRELSSADQLDLSVATVQKYHFQAFNNYIPKRALASNSEGISDFIMPSTINENQDATVTASPSKRKLSSSSPSTSPEKKVLKQEESVKSDAKMPSSVPSSPLKESTTTNLPVGSPAKKLVLGASEVKPKEPSKLQFAKLSDKAHAPTKGSEYAAGFDLKSAYEYTVPKRGSCLVKTDIQVKVPEGTYGRVAPRSGLALKNKIDVGAGVIDPDYRGNVGVILFNFGDEDFQISPGDRVAQLICEKIEYPAIEEVKTLDETERGEGGFGSTGVKS